MAARDLALTMCDTSACDAQPSGELGPDYSVPCHTEMQTRRGIWNLENVDTKSLVDKKIFEGAFIWAPLRIIGATGSPGNPMVLYLSRFNRPKRSRHHRRAEGRSGDGRCCSCSLSGPAEAGYCPVYVTFQITPERGV